MRYRRPSQQTLVPSLAPSHVPGATSGFIRIKQVAPNSPPFRLSPHCSHLISSIRDGRYDLADYFYREAYREGAVSHWQQQQQQQPESPAQAAAAEADGVTSAVRASASFGDGGGGGGRGGGGENGQGDHFSGVEDGVMDLHGHSLPLAHAAVR